MTNDIPQKTHIFTKMKIHKMIKFQRKEETTIDTKSKRKPRILQKYFIPPLHLLSFLVPLPKPLTRNP